ncbi:MULTISPECIES: TIGR02678 family protein [unclassified Crossiella]|uniref:TIGR02678 family protein n=1 Tax=unclassified Crossiella TaxID=2620835 RepID=UPI001FFFD438|nr:MULTISPECIES: TIGR02678 family protein [unclassified Crossiella]MCK2241901.1 TIGR02678 family protein [Crossiella sp. S99.2]MCK2255804.1 TIGR02678 family protein [Crossiella sp. S99.1]
MVTSGVSDEHSRAEFARCIRALLREPMLDWSVGEVFGLVVRRQRALHAWFSSNVGWELKVEAEKGFARLRKLTTDVAVLRPMMTTGRWQPFPFDRSRYSLLCVVAAVLREFPRGQVSLQEIVKRVAIRTTADDALPGYTATGDQRSAMVDVLKEMTRIGVITLVDNEGDYELQDGADALYDIDEHRLVDIFVSFAPAPQSTVQDSSPAILGEERLTSAQQQSARRMVMRRLLDEPVVYVDSLSAVERRWLDTGTRQLSRLLSDTGFELEVRRDGWCAIDPTTESTDTEFPRLNAIVDQAALMVCMRLNTEEAELPRWIPSGRLLVEIGRLLAERPTWAKTYRKAGGGEHLTSQVSDRLCAFGLARPDRNGLVLQSALGRFRQVIISGREDR